MREELIKTVYRDEGIYELPVHYDGYENPWYVNITGVQCRRLIINSLFPFNFFRIYPEFVNPYNEIPMYPSN